MPELFAFTKPTFGVDVPRKLPIAWALALGPLLVFGPFVIEARAEIWRSFWSFGHRIHVPGWSWACIFLIGHYTRFNFFILLGATEGGSTSIRDGKFFLESHGRFIRELTADQFRAFQVRQVRGIFAHILWFYFLPFSYFMFGSNRMPATGKNSGRTVDSPGLGQRLDSRSREGLPPAPGG